MDKELVERILRDFGISVEKDNARVQEEGVPFSWTLPFDEIALKCFTNLLEKMSVTQRYREHHEIKDWMCYEIYKHSNNGEIGYQKAWIELREAILNLFEDMEEQLESEIIHHARQLNALYLKDEQKKFKTINVSQYSSLTRKMQQKQNELSEMMVMRQNAPKWLKPRWLKDVLN